MKFENEARTGKSYCVKCLRETPYDELNGNDGWCDGCAQSEGFTGLVSADHNPEDCTAPDHSQCPRQPVVSSQYTPGSVVGSDVSGSRPQASARPEIGQEIEEVDGE